MRIMDGLRCGKPILTHKNSIRGYESFVGKPYFRTYSNIDEFTTSIDSLISGIKDNTFTPEEIQTDFVKAFSIEAGISRLKEIFD